MRYREKNDVKKEHSYRFLRESCCMAPVVMSLGNRELYLTDKDKRVLSGAGVLTKYHYGLYGNRMVVSAGCSNTASIPRLGNETQVVVVRITM